MKLQPVSRADRWRFAWRGAHEARESGRSFSSNAASRRSSPPSMISSIGRPSRRRQFGWASVVPGRLACSISPVTILDLHQHQSRPRAREIALDRLAKRPADRRLRRLSARIAPIASRRKQSFGDQRIEQQVTVAHALSRVGGSRGSIGIEIEPPAPGNVAAEPEALQAWRDHGLRPRRPRAADTRCGGIKLPSPRRSNIMMR